LDQGLDHPLIAQRLKGVTDFIKREGILYVNPDGGVERAALQLAHDAVSGGALGVDMGRNIFQSDNPVGMIRAVRQGVHEHKTPDEAFRFLTGLRSAAA
jgi:pyridoxal biosynthesis lyase PdxS